MGVSQFRSDFDQQLGDFQLHLEIGDADSAAQLLLGIFKLLAAEIEKITSPPCDSPDPARPPRPSEH